MNINRNDLADLVATYQTIIKESHGVEGRSGEPASEHIRHKDQTPYTQDDMGINTSHYKTVQPGMGKTHDAMSDEQKREVYDVMYDDRPNKLTTIYDLVAGGKWSLDMFKYFIKLVSRDSRD
jgi:hypothetical protein